MLRLTTMALAGSLMLTAVASSSAESLNAQMLLWSGNEATVTLAQNTPQVERRGDDVYLNGQRGSKQRRSGWTQQNGFWFPPEAFAAKSSGGSNRGPDRAPDRAQSQHSSQHVAWCKERYRSYRASDNSYQPNGGPRRQCASPFS